MDFIKTNSEFMLEGKHDAHNINFHIDIVLNEQDRQHIMTLVGNMKYFCAIEKIEKIKYLRYMICFRLINHLELHTHIRQFIIPGLYKVMSDCILWGGVIAS